MMLLTKASIHSSSSTMKSYDISQSINYKTKNVCYLVSCKGCADQYVGETKRQLNHHTNGHKSDIKLKKKGLLILKHFDSCLAETFEVASTEKCRSRDSYIRKATESFYCILLKPKINAEM